MRRLALLTTLPLLWAAPAVGQPAMAGMPGMANTPGMHQVSPPKKPTAKRHRAKSHRLAEGAPARAMHGMTGMSAAPGPSAQPAPSASMPGMAMPLGAAAPAATQAAPGMANMPGMAGMPATNAAAPAQGAVPEPAIPNTPPPPPALDHLADRYFDPKAMAMARQDMRMEMGGRTFSKFMSNLAEYQTGSHGDGYRWDAQAWIGGDINRLVLRSEGEGEVKGGLETGEVQALYSRAISRYFDVQAGVRQDFSPLGRTYLTLGTQGLFPYWFEVEGAVFLSTQGELLARAEGSYDVRLTQRLVLQPRAELNFAAQNTAKTLTGSGLSNAELGLRLRYEIRREFAPYIGVSWDRRLGRTADYWRAAGREPEATTFVVGLRTWF